MTILRRIPVLLLLVFAFITLVIGLALAAKNKNSADYAGGMAPRVTSDLVAGFSLAGNVLGVLMAIMGIAIVAYGRWTPSTMAAWLFLTLIAVWLLGGAVATMSAEINDPAVAEMGRPPIWNAQLAFDVISSILLVISAAAMVSALALTIYRTTK